MNRKKYISAITDSSFWNVILILGGKNEYNAQVKLLATEDCHHELEFVYFR